MTAMLITFLLAALIVGIFLRNALHALLLVGLVLGMFFISCYAFDVSPKVILFDGVHEAHAVYKTHRHELRRYL